MNSILRAFMKAIMYLVRIIRRDKFHYLTVSDEVISWIKVHRIMNFGHFIPSLIVSLLISVKLLPMFSVSYAQQLEENSPVIFNASLVLFLIMLIINGFLIETILEVTNPNYKKEKQGK